MRQLVLTTATRSVPTIPDIICRHVSSRKVHTFSRGFFGPTISLGSVAYLAGYSFQLNLFPNYTEFVALFDKYRLVQIQVEFLPQMEESSFQPGVTTSIPVVGTAIDYDDANAPGSLNDILQYETFTTVPLGTYFKRCLTPHASLAAYSGTFTSYNVAPSTTWFDAASPAVQYYGLKVAIPPLGGVSTSMLIYQVVITGIFEFKNVH